MDVPGDINLLQTKTRLAPELLALVEKLRTAGWIMLSGTLVVGVATGLLFFLLGGERQRVAEDKRQLLAAMTSDAKKESVFVSVKERIPLVERALSSEKAWGQIFDTVGSIAQPPKLYSLSVDDKQLVALNLKTNSLDEVGGWITSILDLFAQKRLRSPQLMGLQLARDGNIVVTIAFIPQ